MECRHLMNPMHTELIHDHHWMDCHGNRCLPTCSLHAVCSAAWPETVLVIAEVSLQWAVGSQGQGGLSEVSQLGPCVWG